MAEKATHSVHNITYEVDGLKHLSSRVQFSKSKMKMCDFSVFTMPFTATGFEHIITVFNNYYKITIRDHVLLPKCCIHDICGQTPKSIYQAS